MLSQLRKTMANLSHFQIFTSTNTSHDNVANNVITKVTRMVHYNLLMLGLGGRPWLLTPSVRKR